MRMEKINEHQVRFIVNNADLSQHKITARELRYGSREAQSLFHDMLERAADEYRFNEEELPVMIEAIPMNDDELMVIISAVEDSEEIDPQFARFREGGLQGDSVLSETMGKKKLFPQDDDLHGMLAFSLHGIEEVITFCKRLKAYPGETKLYKQKTEHDFYLLLIKPEDWETRDFLVYVIRLLEYGEAVQNDNLLCARLLESDVPVMENPHKTLSKM